MVDMVALTDLTVAVSMRSETWNPRMGGRGDRRVLWGNGQAIKFGDRIRSLIEFGKERLGDLG